MCVFALKVGSTKGGSAAAAGAFKLATAAAAVEKCGIMGDVKNTQIPNQMIRAGGDHDNLHSEGLSLFKAAHNWPWCPLCPANRVYTAELLAAWVCCCGARPSARLWWHNRNFSTIFPTAHSCQNACLIKFLSLCAGCEFEPRRPVPFFSLLFCTPRSAWCNLIKI